MFDFRRIPQLLERALANLPDPFPGHTQHGADTLERQRLTPLFETVIERQNPLLPRGEIATEEGGKEFLAKSGVD